MSNYIEQASQLHINLADVAEWVGLHYGRNFECEPFEKRSEWVERYAEGHEILKPAASREVVQREITIHNFRAHHQARYMTKPKSTIQSRMVMSSISAAETWRY